MKKFWIFALCLLLVGCSTAGTDNEKSTKDPDKIQIVASFYPIADFARRIGGDHVEITTLIDASVDPHSWEMSTKDRNAIEEADLFIYNGAGFEHWVDDLLPTLENKDLVVLEASKDVVLQEGHAHEEDAHHDHDDHDDHDHEEEAHDHGAFDTHTWISLRNGVTMLGTIKDALIAHDPTHEKDYAAKFEEHKKAFETLDQKATETFSDVKRKDFIVGHESFGYFAYDYGLTQHGIEDAASHGEPDPKTIKELVDLAKEKGIKTVFYDPFGSDKIAQTVAGEIGGQAMELNPLEGRTPEEIQDGYDYLDIMDKNITAIHKALTE